jgi:predicted ThiF/HesA family dinucleotide-utilizing enzyme
VISGLEIKKPPSLAVCLDLLGLVRCRVNLPLLHRHRAGIAKVKVAGKENVLAHTRSGWSSDYSNKL